MADESLERWRRASELFDQVRDLDPEARMSFLADACGSDAELIELVKQLVESEGWSEDLPAAPPLERARSLLERLAAEKTDSEPSPAAPGSPEAPTLPDTTLHASDEIGPYRLLQKIGEGGMGEVWRAEQTRPIRREVALKVIKAGLDTKRVVARFEMERQVLALMDHPAIAKVYEAGETPRGSPYFAMEYVAGEPVTDYCDRHRLGTQERLDLFARICAGVQHAHEKGVIHRDLKPSNVLVTLQGDRPVPKIIDFGVAKATAQRLTERTLFTELGVMIGTPSYMSPEQADLTGLNVDTRTDVYALGVMLYELLTGVLPFDAKTLREAGYDEIRRRIREVDPPKPSTRAEKLGEDSAEIARKRGTVPSKLVSRLRGDLDWIVMKCLEKDRLRRYASPNELAADLKRHLAHEPVAASPPGAAYRARKFVRRHRVGVSVAAAGVVALATFALTTQAQNRRIAAERDRADREAEVSRRVTDFMTGLFEVSDPSEARGNTVTAREILDRGAEKIGKELEGEPDVKARMLLSMGQVYKNLGLPGKAAPMLEEAEKLDRRVLGSDDRETLHVRCVLGQTYYALDRYQDARELLEATAATQRRVLGEEDSDLLESLDALALTLLHLDRFDESRELYEHILEVRRRTLGPDAPQTILALIGLGSFHVNQREWPEAEKSLREAVESGQRVLGENHPDVLGAMGSLAFVLHSEGHLEEAEAIYRRAVAGRSTVFGPEHPLTTGVMSALAVVLTDEGKFDEADEIFRKVIEIRRRNPGLETFGSLVVLNAMGNAYSAMGRLDDADGVFTEMHEIAQRILGPRDRTAYVSAFNLACVATKRGRHQEALKWLRAAVTSGYTDTTEIREDPDLQPLRDDPEFDRILRLVGTDSTAAPAAAPDSAGE